MSSTFLDSLTDDAGFEQLQARLLQAAINNDSLITSKLPQLRDGFEEPYRTIAGTIVRMKRLSKPVDRSTLMNELEQTKLARRTPQGNEELSSEQALNLVESVAGEEVPSNELLQKMAELISQKKLMEMQARMGELASKIDKDPLKTLQEIMGEASKALRDQLASNDECPSELSEFFPFAQSLLNRQTGSAFSGLDSGFDHINSVCNGLDTGLTVIAAPPGRGKTTWMWQICCQVAEKEQVPVIFVSMEQSKYELRTKALARLASIEYCDLLRGKFNASNSEHVVKLQEALGMYFNICKNITIVEGDGSTNTDKILEIALSKKQEGKRCLIAVDYIQKIPPCERDSSLGGASKERVDAIISNLRRLARELDSPVLAISSQNRSGYDSKKMSVFKESGEIEYSADVAIVLTKSKISSNESDEFRNLDLNVIKNRNGETATIRCKFYPKYAKFIEIEKVDLTPDEDSES